MHKKEGSYMRSSIEWGQNSNPCSKMGTVWCNYYGCNDLRNICISARRAKYHLIKINKYSGICLYFVDENKKLSSINSINIK